MSYFVRINAKVFGPYDESQLLAMKAKGKLTRVTEVSENEQDWQAAETYPFLYGAINTAPQAFQSPVDTLADRYRSANIQTQHATSAPEPEPDFTFEIRLDGKRVSVTKSRLFELARTGAVTPEDLVVVDGVKVYADTIRGIVFGDSPPMDAPPSSVIAPAARKSALPDMGKRSPLDSPPDAEESVVLTLPPRRGLRMTSEFDMSWREFLDKNVKPIGITMGVICLLGVLGFFFLTSGGTKYGTINIEGTVTLDGSPVGGVSVILHPRDEGGTVAGGVTKKNGKFTVTTDIVVNPKDPLRGTVPMVSGVLPGVYDLTFYKLEDSEGIMRVGERLTPKYLVPKRYGDVKTSGLPPIRVESKGTRKFSFELSSAEKTGGAAKASNNSFTDETEQ